MKKKYFLFDLDGTLTNSKEGITKSVQYALEAFGISEPNQDKLECYIGPALDESFQVYHGMTQDQANAAVVKYRERYTDTGLFENEVYEGIEECLKVVKEHGGILAVATCKPEVMAVRILEYFNLSQYFDVICGCELDGGRKHKNEVIEEVFRRLAQKAKDENADSQEDLISMKADAIMIGDRRQDIIGAKQTNIESVGVRYGFAEDGELEEACADYIVQTPADLSELLISM